MKDWQRVLLDPGSSISRALEVIDNAGVQIGLVADGEGRLLGTVSDGDIRRGLIRGVALSEPVSIVMNPEPSCVTTKQDPADVLALMRGRGFHQIPILTPDRRIVGLATIDDFLVSTRQDHWVVIMAGGKGTRLRELTANTPKPMLKVGSRPLLETIIRRYIDQGFHNFYLAVNYRAEQIEDHFGDGSTFGAQIRYLREDKALGTAGALSLLPERPTGDIIVSNGDLLTNENHSAVLSGHAASGAKATMLVRDYEMQVPFGVVAEEAGQIVSITEKPIERFTISAGMYVLAPDALDFVPGDQFFDMPALFERLIENKLRTRCHRVQGYWLDVGRLPDLERANLEFAKYFE